MWFVVDNYVNACCVTRRCDIMNNHVSANVSICLARDAQAKLASPYCRTVSVHPSVHTVCPSVCPRQLESRVCTQLCASRATSTTGLFPPSWEGGFCPGFGSITGQLHVESRSIRVWKCRRLLTQDLRHVPHSRHSQCTMTSHDSGAVQQSWFSLRSNTGLRNALHTIKYRPIPVQCDNALTAHHGAILFCWIGYWVFGEI